MRIQKRDLAEQITILQSKGRWLQFVNRQKDNKPIINIKNALNSNSVTKSGNNENLTKRKNESKISKSTNSKEHHSDIKFDVETRREQEIPIKATGFYNISDLDQGKNTERVNNGKVKKYQPQTERNKSKKGKKNELIPA